ncbi:hypothetical protein AB6A40_006726 [Gnathostoma spinigerum]|uniref:Uncharacterized protein n=1 Tax=Gnathostoma spinigerum TaxID=75299 RepID=A0ABD6ETZ1_9BILA
MKSSVNGYIRHNANISNGVLDRFVVETSQNNDDVLEMERQSLIDNNTTYCEGNSLTEETKGNEIFYCDTSETFSPSEEFVECSTDMTTKNASISHLNMSIASESEHILIRDPSTPMIFQVYQNIV